MSVDMGQHIAPKSDQLNADDLIAGPRTVTITSVTAHKTTEQPVAIYFEGDNGKPYLPCKSMRRVAVYVWGSDTKAYIGRSMTLYCDPNVSFGGEKVGGIRISHMSHIDAPQTMALTATRARRAAFTVQPLTVIDVAAIVEQFELATDQASFDAAEKVRSAAWKSLSKDSKALLKKASDTAKAELAAKVAEPSGQSAE